MGSNEGFLTFMGDVQSNACLLNVHCAGSNTRNKRVIQLVFLQENMKSALL
jgi:hypothetical protein